MRKFLEDYGGIDSEEFENVHITADLHFRHDKILNFEPIREELREKAEFTGTPDEFLIHTWNSQVGKKDLVINLGDLHWKSLEPFANKLNGTMLLVLGNHDAKPQYYDKFPRIYAVDGVWNLNGTPSRYYLGDKEVDKLMSGFIYEDNLFCHYPVYNIEHEYNYQRKSPGAIVSRMEKFKDIMADHTEVLYNIHGHLHSSCPEGNALSLNVCIDFNKYKLLNFRDAINKVKES